MFDLNIPLDSATPGLLQHLNDLGYKSIALVQDSIEMQPLTFNTSLKLKRRIHIKELSHKTFKFDLVSIQPSNEKGFAAACQSDVDIITIDMSKKLDFYFRPANINMALSHGIQFEIVYAGALRDPQTKRHLVTNASALVQVSRFT